MDKTDIAVEKQLVVSDELRAVVESVGFKCNLNPEANLALGTSIPVGLIKHVFVAGAEYYAEAVERERVMQDMEKKARLYDANVVYGYFLEFILMTVVFSLMLVDMYATFWRSHG